MNKSLHIISFDIPYPPNYGGVIDVYYKIKSLYDLDININLHCFEYGREHSKELEKLCKSIYYYPRKVIRTYFFNKLPYIVVSRTSEELANNLLKDNYPILMEGLHSCYLLNDYRFRARKICVRTHNVEHLYYGNLARVEKNIFRRYYFYSEVPKLEIFENVLSKATSIAAISKSDMNYFSTKYSNVNYIPAFHPNKKVDIKQERGSYVLYHGNLAVGENNAAALYLANNIFNDLNIPLIIAGNNPSKDLKNTVAKNSNIELKCNISTEGIHDLIRKAQINILPTFQATGIKLKLLAALHLGKYCIVNTPMVKDTGLEELCIIANSDEEIKAEVKKFFEMDFREEQILLRKTFLNENFSNDKNAIKLSQLLFDHQFLE